MKVLITGCEDKNAWYANKIGDEFEVEVNNDKFFEQRIDNDKYLCSVLEVLPARFLLKSDCHIIQPAWEVMKEAEGQLVEYWKPDKKEWREKDFNSAWFTDAIYRLKPEPPQPEWIPLEGEELAALAGKVVNYKGSKSRYVITGYYEDSDKVCLNGNDWIDAKELFEGYTLDGSPIGKRK